MRIFLVPVLSGVTLVLAACSGVAASSSPASVGAEAVSPAAPVPALSVSPDAARQAAAAAGRQMLENPGFSWVGEPVPVVVEDLSYAEAVQKVGVGEPHFDQWPAETRVWLVILEGQWLLAPMGPQGAPPNQFQGCLLVVFTAADHQFISAGDALCPPRP